METCLTFWLFWRPPGALKLHSTVILNTKLAWKKTPCQCYHTSYCTGCWKFISTSTSKSISHNPVSTHIHRVCIHVHLTQIRYIINYLFLLLNNGFCNSISQKVFTSHFTKVYTKTITPCQISAVCQTCSKRWLHNHITPSTEQFYS